MSTIASASALLDISGLSITYGHGDEAVVAAQNIDLTLKPGEIVALVGESGSGKSTLSKAIIGLLPQSARILGGSINLGGENLLSRSERELASIRGRRIGMVPQDPGASLDPVKTVGSQISEVFRLHPQGHKLSRVELRAEVIRLLELVGIDTPEQRISQYPHELSGGLKQRVLIAIAFALKPELLIADEPTSALDVTVQQTVLEVFTKLARELGTAVIFVTHDLAVATDIADRIVVMQHGQIREDRPVLEILRSPEDAYTRMLLTEATASGDASRIATGMGAITVPAIEVAGLTQIYGRGKTERAAVDEVSFAVRPGTTFSLVGESGSGKSTTARMIMRLLEPTAGTVKIHGQDVTHARGIDKRELWRSLQLVYQNPDSALDPRYSVSRIISEPLENYKVGSKAERRLRVAELLDAVNLPTRMAALGAKELSGGQRQRVAIARALALGAKTLVLDEALSALDVLTQAQILALLEDLQVNQGLSYLFISHDLHVVERISHDVGVMRQGRLVEVGTATQVLNNPTSEYTRLLLDSNPGALLREMATN
ncbi:dipeptide ABC transporter ATP-binding protein [Paeniglutamicibacter terrestris]|uniref:ABC transporter ATP-binding protein n=1 Tax=Paeniglutamicibacter terrestris TaxID=2723403 RepID=A0ABX1G4L5_9MICC|nr:ABC transporter ATP-binding protein [Paeniglutamicibacter terrestris]ASN40686.1 ABC transporter ATP-binding protein [Arthrobacter sp. 7749]NKG21179.1 ABC transporter ATP-binding protein [Paeniglutamicibacter terrestris]